MFSIDIGNGIGIDIGIDIDIDIDIGIDIDIDIDIGIDIALGSRMNGCLLSSDSARRAADPIESPTEPPG